MYKITYNLKYTINEKNYYKQYTSHISLPWRDARMLDILNITEPKFILKIDSMPDINMKHEFNTEFIKKLLSLIWYNVKYETYNSTDIEHNWSERYSYACVPRCSIIHDRCRKETIIIYKNDKYDINLIKIATKVIPINYSKVSDSFIDVVIVYDI